MKDQKLLSLVIIIDGTTNLSESSNNLEGEILIHNLINNQTRNNVIDINMKDMALFQVKQDFPLHWWSCTLHALING